jgi:hypothetical protein
MPKSKSRKKNPPKRVLALPDLENSKAAVLNNLTSASGQRRYDHASREFVAWDWELVDARAGVATARARKALDPACTACLRDCRDVNRLWAPPRRTPSSDPRVDPGARGTLGHCRSDWQGWTRPNGSDSDVGEGCRGRVDRGGWHHSRPGLSGDQQGRARLGRRHVPQGALGHRACCCGSRRDREISAA